MEKKLWKTLKRKIKSIPINHKSREERNKQINFIVRREIQSTGKLWTLTTLKIKPK